MKIIGIILLLLLIFLVLDVLFFNVTGVKDKYVIPLLSNIPVINNLLPPETVEEDVSGETSELMSLSKEELIAMIEELEAEVEALNEEINRLTALRIEDSKEIERLQAFEEEQLQFEQEKEEFDRMIAEGSPVDYMEYYESIDPENAAMLYQEAVTKDQLSKDVQKFYNDIAAMDTSSAAKTLEEMINTDMEIVVDILENLDSEQTGAILSEMSEENAAKVIKNMSVVVDEYNAVGQ